MQDKETRNRRAMIAFAVIALVIVCAHLLPVVGDRQPVVYGMEAAVPHWDGKSHFYFQEAPLSRGYYTVSIEYNTSYAMRCRVNIGHDSARHYFYADDPVDVPVGQGVQTFSLWVRTDIPVRIALEEAAESAQFTEASFVLHLTYRPMKSLSYELFLALEKIIILGAGLLFVARFRKAQDAEERLVLFGLGVLVLLINLPTYVDYLPYGHDLPMHVTRIEHLAEGLRNGVFPVKMHPGWYHGYGNPIGIGYADTFLYPAALLHLLAVPLWKCFQVYERVMNIALVLISYVSFKKIAGGKRRIAFTGTVLYGIGVYFIIDLYVRGAVGEAAAMVFLPLVAAGFYALMKEDARGGMIFLVLGYTGLLQSHNITTMATAMFSALFCIIFWKQMVQASRLIPLIKAALMTVVINLGYLVPMLDYTTRYEFRTKAWYSTHMQGVGSSLAQLMMTDYDPTGNRMGQGVAGQMPLTVGWALLAVLLAACFFLMRKKEGRVKKAVGGLTALSAIALLISTSSFPYHWLDLHLHFIYQMIGETFHMPWRYLTMAAILLSTLAVVLLDALYSENEIRPELMTATICVLIGLAAWQGVGLMSRWMNATYPTMQLEAGGTIGENLFIPKEVDLDGMVYDNEISGTAAVDHVFRKGTTFTMSVSNPFEEEAFIDLPLWGFYGYTATDLQGNRFEISGDVFTNVRVFVPATYAGEITVRFREPLYWRIAEVVALIGVLMFIFYIFVKTSIKVLPRRPDI